MWTTGTGSTWWILALSVPTSRWTQSGRKEPLNPTNANLSAKRWRHRKTKGLKINLDRVQRFGGAKRDRAAYTTVRKQDKKNWGSNKKVQYVQVSDKQRHTHTHAGSNTAWTCVTASVCACVYKPNKIKIKQKLNQLKVSVGSSELSSISISPFFFSNCNWIKY